MSAIVEALIAGAIVTAGVAPAKADDWWLMSVSGQKPQRRAILFDRSTIIATDGIAGGWLETVYESKTSLGLKSLKVQSEFDCAARKVRDIEIIGRDENGKVVIDDKTAWSWQPVVQRSSGHQHLRFACGDGSVASKINTDDPVTYSDHLFVDRPHK